MRPGGIQRLQTVEKVRAGHLRRRFDWAASRPVLLTTRASAFSATKRGDRRGRRPIGWRAQPGINLSGRAINAFYLSHNILMVPLRWRKARP